MVDENICFSGGAKGADSLFGQCAEVCDHKVMHFSFIGHKPAVKANIYPISDLDLQQADKFLKRANLVLKRGTFPYESDYVNNMLRRNYFQIKQTERVYAVTSLDRKTGLPSGGTAWALVMAAQKGIRDIFVFDQSTNLWRRMYDWVCAGFPESVVFDTMKWIDERPEPPHGHYTGIGSRDLTTEGANAIIKLYEECE